MIKEIMIFNYSKRLPYEEAEAWYLQKHVHLVKELPHLIKYVNYRALDLPKNDFFPSPEFFCMEELWWPNKASFLKAQASEEKRRVLEDLNEEPKLRDIKHVLLEKEINVLHPEMTGSFQLTMNELDGKPHVKSLWPINYLRGLSLEEAEEWYLNHHTLLAAKNFNLVRYVTYRTFAGPDGDEHDFPRFTELCWRDWETILNDFQSPRGLEVLEDNKNEDGEWRVVTETSFLKFPHVVGYQRVFI